MAGQKVRHVGFVVFAGGSPMADLFLRDRERVYGPYPPAHIKQLAASGRITPAWSIGTSKEGPWATAGNVRGVFPAADAIPPEPKPLPARRTTKSAGFTRLQWSLVVTAALLPWLVAAAFTRPVAVPWRLNRPAVQRQQAAAPATGRYLEDLPDAVQRSKRQGKDLLVLFTADWCGPCRRLKQDLARAESLRRELLVCVVDFDKQRALCELHGVQGIPDLRLFRQGEQVKHATGYGGSLADLETWVRAR